MQNQPEPTQINPYLWLSSLGVDCWSGKISDLKTLDLTRKQLTRLPESIFQMKGCANWQLTNLKTLNLASNQLASLPESFGNLTNLMSLNLRDNRLTSLPEPIVQLANLQQLYLENNQLNSLPESIEKLTNLQKLNLCENQLTYLSPLQKLTQPDLEVRCFETELPRRYWRKFSDWQAEWLLDENNAEIRRVLIQQVGYEKICDRLGAEAMDTWREYTLIKIDNIQAVYDEVYNEEPIYLEPLLMLKMTCPSTGHIHILRVPPEMTSAEAAITWVNHGIHPDDIAIQT